MLIRGVLDAVWGERLAAAFTMPAFSGSLHSALGILVMKAAWWRCGRDDRHEDFRDERRLSRAPVGMCGLKGPLFHRVAVIAVIGKGSGGKARHRPLDALRHFPSHGLRGNLSRDGSRR